MITESFRVRNFQNGRKTKEGQQRKHLAGKLHRTIVAALLVLTSPFAFISAAQAEDVIVRVQIEQTEWFCGDGPFGGPPEIYFKVTIDGNLLSSRGNPIFSNFSPFSVGREFSQSVDFSAGTIAIKSSSGTRMAF